MACNCATKEELNKLYKAYGEKSKLPEKPKFADYIRYYCGNGLAYLLMVLCFPLLILYVFALLFWREDYKIHVSDIDFIKIFNKK